MIYLGRSIGQENVTRIVQDKTDAISPAEMTKMAEAAKQAVREFVELEQKDVKEYVFAQGSQRRGDSYFTQSERALPTLGHVSDQAFGMQMQPARRKCLSLQTGCR